MREAEAIFLHIVVGLATDVWLPFPILILIFGRLDKSGWMLAPSIEATGLMLVCALIGPLHYFLFWLYALYLEGKPQSSTAVDLCLEFDLIYTSL